MEFVLKNLTVKIYGNFLNDSCPALVKMKILHLGLVLTSIMFVMIYTNPAHADSDLIKILDVQVQPSTIKVNNTFSVSAIILNNSTYPVYLTSGSCVPAFSVEFDSHSKQVYPDIACTLEEIIQRVDPNVETTISSVNKPGTIYKAIQAGTANANITIPYFIKNQTATDDSNIYYNTSKSFSFPILNQSETPQQHVYGGGGPVVTITLDPLEQFKSGISAKDVTCKEGFQLVIKAEDGSPACVKPDTAQKLIERGWAKITVTKATFDVMQSNTTQTNAMANLGNDTGITTIGNQAYYFETPNYSHDAYFNSPQISFHDVIFTLFPSGFRGGLPTNGCGGQYYWTDVKFSDGTSELLHIFVGSPQCSDSQPPTYFSTHTNPQAGLIFYDGKMKLLISVEEK